MSTATRALTALALGGLITLAAPTPATAQWLFAGVGPTIPVGDYGEYANTGYVVNVGLGYDVTPVVSFGTEGFYGYNAHEDDGSGYDDSTTLYGGFFFLQYTPVTTSRLSPHVRGGLGLLVHEYSSDFLPDISDNGMAWFLGGGVNYGMGTGWGLRGEGQFTSASIAGSATSFFSILGGVYFTFGGG